MRRDVKILACFAVLAMLAGCGTRETSVSFDSSEPTIQIFEDRSGVSAIKPKTFLGSIHPSIGDRSEW